MPTHAEYRCHNISLDYQCDSVWQKKGLGKFHKLFYSDDALLFNITTKDFPERKLWIHKACAYYAGIIVRIIGNQFCKNNSGIGRFLE